MAWQSLLWQQWGLFDKQFGRSDAQEPDPEGRIPLWGKASVKEMKDKFSAIGFGPRQVISSLFGAASNSKASFIVLLLNQETKSNLISISLIIPRSHSDCSFTIEDISFYSSKLHRLNLTHEMLYVITKQKRKERWKKWWNVELILYFNLLCS